MHEAAATLGSGIRAERLPFFYIQRAAPHRAVNRGQQAAEILMVISPADTF